MLSMLLLMQGRDNVKYVIFNAGGRGGTMLSMLGGVPMANYGELWRIAQLCWARFAIKTFAIIRHNSP